MAYLARVRFFLFKMMKKRHCESLMKECRKERPDKKVINLYSNNEFLARRNWLKLLSPEARSSEFFKKYPCYSNANEVKTFSVFKT